METFDIATSFVDLALKYNWSTVKKLTDEELRILFETVSAAGFEPKKIVLGTLVGHYRDEDGDTGETYPINGFCPYKVVSDNDYHATGWLDRLLQLTIRETDRQKLIKIIQNEIERSVPLKPIQLTPDEDMLCEYPHSKEYLTDHTRDEHKLSSCVGVHCYCRGWMDRVGATKTHDAIICRNCHLRVLFPKKITTYGQLRETLAAKFAKITA